MLSNASYGFHNGRQLNIRGNFTRVVKNKFGEDITKELCKVSGTPIE